MKLTNTLTAISIIGLTSFASAGESCSQTCDKMTKKASKCGIEKCGTDCETGSDMDIANMATFMVKDMTCTACSKKVNSTLAAVDGVTVQKVCHNSGKVMVKLDPAKTDKSKVIAAINTTDFKVAGEMLSIPVSGMTCGACSDKVTKALTTIEGCSAVSVCHKSGHVSVVIDTAKTSEAKVMEAIQATGFKTAKEVKVTKTTKVNG